MTIPSFIEISYGIDWPETTLADGEDSVKAAQSQKLLHFGLNIQKRYQSNPLSIEPK